MSLTLLSTLQLLTFIVATCFCWLPGEMISIFLSLCLLAPCSPFSPLPVPVSPHSLFPSSPRSLFPSLPTPCSPFSPLPVPVSPRSLFPYLPTPCSPLSPLLVPLSPHSLFPSLPAPCSPSSPHSHSLSPLLMQPQRCSTAITPQGIPMQSTGGVWVSVSMRCFVVRYAHWSHYFHATLHHLMQSYSCFGHFASSVMPLASSVMPIYLLNCFSLLLPLVLLKNVFVINA